MKAAQVFKLLLLLFLFILFKGTLLDYFVLLSKNMFLVHNYLKI